MQHSLKYFLCVLCLICLGQRTSAQDLNQLLVRLNENPTSQESYQLMYEIGMIYQSQNAHYKAIEYLEKAYQVKKNEGDIESQINVLKKLPYSYQQLNQVDKSREVFERLYALQSQQSNTNEQTQSLNELAKYAQKTKNFSAALQYSNQLLGTYQSQKDSLNLANTYNNLGYIYRQLGNVALSKESFYNAIKYYQALSKPQSKVEALTLINAGVTFTQVNDFDNARKYYSEGLNKAQSSGDFYQQATIYNYLAVNEKLNENYNQAIQALLKAIQIGEANQLKEPLMVSYQLLGEMYQEVDNLIEAQKYFKKYNDLSKIVNEEERKKQQAFLERQLEIERKENELKSLMVEREKQNANLRQAEMERAQQDLALKAKENELALIKREQDLQSARLKAQALEKEKIQQLLMIEQQKSIVSLAEKEKQRQALYTQKIIAAKQKLENEQRQKKLEAQQALQLKQLEQERLFRQYVMVMLTAGTILLLGLIYGILKVRRSNKLLKERNTAIRAQQAQIRTQNEELAGRAEEISAQRDSIEASNQELRKREAQITSSINAATFIQNAIMPSASLLKEALNDYFIIFKPRDIVSGDFYWMSKQETRTFLATVDCTGHGVPGAFMTLIASEILDKIINIRRLSNPAYILEALHEQIRTSLNQEESNNDNGMDMAMVIIVRKEDRFDISFCGAKQSLYFIPQGEHKIQILRGDRRGIGGFQNDDVKFHNHTISLALGSVLYLGSDGFSDQNDFKRKKFGEKKLIELLETNSHLTMEQQKEKLESALNQHMAGTEQRDDIVWMGIKLS
jgi:serine phosphatase RsbU (regulator of sigma subunit)